MSFQPSNCGGGGDCNNTTIINSDGDVVNNIEVELELEVLEQKLCDILDVLEAGDLSVDVEVDLTEAIEKLCAIEEAIQDQVIDVNLTADDIDVNVTVDPVDVNLTADDINVTVDPVEVEVTLNTEDLEFPDQLTTFCEELCVLDADGNNIDCIIAINVFNLETCEVVKTTLMQVDPTTGVMAEAVIPAGATVGMCKGTICESDCPKDEGGIEDLVCCEIQFASSFYDSADVELTFNTTGNAYADAGPLTPAQFETFATSALLAEAAANGWANPEVTFADDKFSLCAEIEGGEEYNADPDNVPSPFGNGLSIGYLFTRVSNDTTTFTQINPHGDSPDTVCCQVPGTSFWDETDLGQVDITFAGEATQSFPAGTFPGAPTNQTVWLDLLIAYHEAQGLTVTDYNDFGGGWTVCYVDEQGLGETLPIDFVVEYDHPVDGRSVHVFNLHSGIGNPTFLGCCLNEDFDTLTTYTFDGNTITLPGNRPGNIAALNAALQNAGYTAIVIDTNGCTNIDPSLLSLTLPNLDCVYARQGDSTELDETRNQ